MAIKDILDDLWESGETVDAAFEFRQAFENAYNTLVATVDKLDELIAENNFDDLDPELLIEGGACQDALEAAILILNDHTNFIIWKEPQ